MQGFAHTFALAERYGQDVTAKKFDGKKFILLNDAMTKKQATSYAGELRKMGYLARMNLTIDGYRVYYRRK